jgi:hypothetical protein
MGWWVARPELDERERVLWSSVANREQAGGRQVGGRLFLTDASRLIFQPNRFDAPTGGEGWQAPARQVTDVREVPKDFSVDGRASAAQLRRRLLIETSDGQQNLFVVNHVGRKVTQLAELLQT